jgi:hypothetical protein
MRYRLFLLTPGEYLKENNQISFYLELVQKEKE